MNISGRFFFIDKFSYDLLFFNPNLLGRKTKWLYLLYSI